MAFVPLFEEGQTEGPAATILADNTPAPVVSPQSPEVPAEESVTLSKPQELLVDGVTDAQLESYLGSGLININDLIDFADKENRDIPAVRNFIASRDEGETVSEAGAEAIATTEKAAEEKQQEQTQLDAATAAQVEQEKEDTEKKEQEQKVDAELADIIMDEAAGMSFQSPESLLGADFNPAAEEELFDGEFEEELASELDADGLDLDGDPDALAAQGKGPTLGLDGAEPDAADMESPNAEIDAELTAAALKAGEEKDGTDANLDNPDITSPELAAGEGEEIDVMPIEELMAKTKAETIDAPAVEGPASGTPVVDDPEQAIKAATAMNSVLGDGTEYNALKTAVESAQSQDATSGQTTDVKQVIDTTPTMSPPAVTQEAQLSPDEPAKEEPSVAPPEAKKDPLPVKMAPMEPWVAALADKFSGLGVDPSKFVNLAATKISDSDKVPPELGTGMVVNAGLPSMGGGQSLAV